MSALRASVCKKLGLSATAGQSDIYRAALKKLSLSAERYTVYPGDRQNSFTPRDFSTREEARRYASQQRGKPWQISLPSGRVVEVDTYGDGRVTVYD